MKKIEVEKHDNNYEFDLVCIGGGSGGLACALKAVELGAKVACIDPQRGAAGIYTNAGITYKKQMHQACLLGKDIRHAAYYGWNICSARKRSINWRKLISSIENATEDVAKEDDRMKYIKFFNGFGSFVDAHSVKIKLINNEELLVTGKHILVATGTQPVYPKIPGSLEYGITSDEFFSLPSPPTGKTLCVGGGVVCMEIAGILNGLNFNVTVMARSEVLRGFDQEMVKLVMKDMTSRGVAFLQHCFPKSIALTRCKRLIVTYNNNQKNNAEEFRIFDRVIWAIGRRALLDDINISAINPALNDSEIIVNEYEETTVPNVYAIGDITSGRPKLFSVAVAAGDLLAQRLFSGAGRTMNYENVARRIFTPLEYSFVGLTEEEAEERFDRSGIQIHHGYYEPLELALTHHCTNFCYMKVIAKCDEHYPILGMHITGPNAGEIMQGFSVAINSGLTLHKLFATVGVCATNAQNFTQLFNKKN
uniref:FAD/NAD(P)-binding domain-containing protein n=1 Tax=Glossina palpalis gambiensis TaxID=67801 RepID=A0A1B0C017_9MUSC